MYDFLFKMVGLTSAEQSMGLNVLWYSLAHLGSLRKLGSTRRDLLGFKNQLRLCFMDNWG